MNEESCDSSEALFVRPAVSMLLNYDILAEICKSIPNVHGILTLTATCSTLRRIGVPYLLRSRKIIVKADNNLLKFRDFALAGSPKNRLAHLRAFEISHGFNHSPEFEMSLRFDHSSNGEDSRLSPSAEELVASVMDILRGAVGLEYLSLGGPRAFFLADDRSLWLQELVSKGILRVMATPNILRCLQSPLKTICGLTLPTIGDDEGQAEDDEERYTREPVYPKDLNALVSHFSTTLQTLQIDALNTNVPLDLNAPQYPAVRSLTVSALLDLPRLDVLMHMFPSAGLSLSLYIPELLYPSVLPSDPQLRAEARIENLAAQNSPGSWTSIGALSCTPTILYLLGLKCPVKILRIVPDDMNGFDTQAKEYISHALRTNLPAKFSLSNLMITDAALVLDGLFPTGATQSIRFLDLDIECGLLALSSWGGGPDPMEHEDLWLDFLVRISLSASTNRPERSHGKFTVVLTNSSGHPRLGGPAPPTHSHPHHVSLSTER